MVVDWLDLPEALRAQAVILSGEPAWTTTPALAVVEFLRQKGSAVVGVEPWVPEGGCPRVLDWGGYDVPFHGDWLAYVDSNAAHAVAEIESAGRSSAVPDEGVFNLTWIGREEYQARRSA